MTQHPPLSTLWTGSDTRRPGGVPACLAAQRVDRSPLACQEHQVFLSIDFQCHALHAFLVKVSLSGWWRLRPRLR